MSAATEQAALELVPVSQIKQTVDLLADMGIDPLHLQADAKHVGDTRHNLSIWLRSRTEFEAVCARMKLKPVERRYTQPGQRQWFAEGDTEDRRLLVQCVSFKHHDDWEPRPEVAS